MTVKILAPVQPVPPEAAAGMPIRPVEFDGMTVTPYLNENGGRPRVAYSLRATGMRSPSAGGAKPSPRSGRFPRPPRFGITSTTRASPPTAQRVHLCSC